MSAAADNHGCVQVDEIFLDDDATPTNNAGAQLEHWRGPAALTTPPHGSSLGIGGGLSSNQSSCSNLAGLPGASMAVLG